MNRITQYINFYKIKKNLKVNEEQQSLIEKAKSKFIARKSGIDGYKMPLYKNIKALDQILMIYLRRRQEGGKSILDY